MKVKNDITHPLVIVLLIIMAILLAITIKINNKVITALVAKRDSLIEVIDSYKKNGEHENSDTEQNENIKTVDSEENLDNLDDK